MPELPEVESVRRALGPLIMNRCVDAVQVHRRDFIDHASTGKGASAAATPRALLVGGVITELRRRGKQLAIITGDQRAIVIHLGMTGQLIALAPGGSPPKHDHVHIEWELAPGAGGTSSPGAGAHPRGGAGRAPLGETARGTLRLLFRDPRRFGCVRPFNSAIELEQHWSQELGPDALNITADQLHTALRDSRMAVKAKLLDQSALAGVGNIYADESLFAASIRPRRAARSLTRAETERLARELRATLTRAVAAGGSTLRDFISPTGSVGSYQSSHLVYGRAGQPCPRCHKPLRSTTIAQRTTVWCPSCQK